MSGRARPGTFRSSRSRRARSRPRSGRTGDSVDRRRTSPTGSPPSALRGKPPPRDARASASARSRSGVVVLPRADAIEGCVMTEQTAGAGAPLDGSTVRLALTLPGGASLGTFEAGAVCALITAVQALNAERPGAAVIDCMAGASAGALTSVLAARVLLAGEDPIPVFRRAWVTEPSLAALLGHGPWAPLTLRRARRVADDVLSAAPANDRPRQEEPIRVDVALGSLRGFAYNIIRPAGSVGARSYI